MTNFPFQTGQESNCCCNPFFCLLKKFGHLDMSTTSSYLDTKENLYVKVDAEALIPA